MSVVPPAGTHSYCTEGEYLLATPGSLYVLALACRGPTFLDTYLLPQQNVHKVRNSLTPQPCGAFLSMLLIPPRSTSSYILLPRLEPSFTDVLPYRLLLLHLNSRLHARRQYRTSVTLMMALHDVARHSVPSSIENRYAREQKSSVPKPFGIRHGGFLHTHDSILPHIFRFEIWGIF